MCPQRKTPWRKDQIRSARRVNLVELLARRGLHLQSTGNGNYDIHEHPGIVVKHSYWCWPERDISGNTIDFFVDVLELSFNHAMNAILNREGNQAVAVRSERGYSVPDSDQSVVTDPKTVRP